MIATDTGARIAGLAQTPRAFVDSFGRPDGPLGNGWIDGHDFDPPTWEPLGIYNRSVVVRDPMARPGARYESMDNIRHPPDDGQQHAGIGCAWRDMGTTRVYVEVVWSGWERRESAPCVHFTPGSERMALGVWPSQLGQFGMFIVGGIGNPPEQFPSYMLGVGAFQLAHGQPRRVGLMTDGAAVTVWMDGEQVPIGPNWGLAPIPVPAELLGSTLHGFELDTHFVQRDLVPTSPVVHKISIRPV